MGTVAYMCFAGGAINTEGSGYGLIMRTALGAALLTMATFWIWHIPKIEK
jgi:hypothetical protein